MLQNCRFPSTWAACLCALLALGPGQEAIAHEDGEDFEEIVVTAHPLADTGLVQPAQVLTEEALDRARDANIGATVERLPGVRSASFGEAAGRPVIHGLAGARVRILEDRTDTMDVSVTSADHMVTVEPSLAERVEVLKGPSTLLYGSGAIGGVVNVDTGRIADIVPEDNFEGRLELRGGDNGDARVGAMRLDGAVGRLVWHVDGFRRDAGDYSIPGYAESARMRAAEHEEAHHDEDEEVHHDEDEDEEDHHDEDDHDADHEDEALDHGHLSGSDYDVSGGAFGLSFVGDRAYAGISFSRIDGDYGLPGHAHAHEHEEAGHHDDHDEAHADDHDDDHDEDHDDGDEDHGDEDEDDHDEHGEEGNAWLDMEQRRVDVELGLLDPFANFERLTARVGYNDYEHAEIEPNGEIGTMFTNKAYDARIELRQAASGAWRNIYGAHFTGREFSALGEEAFAPPVDTTSAALFWAGERSFGDTQDMQLESGLRIERVSHEPAAARESGPERRFTAYAASLGVIAPAGDAWRLSLVGDWSVRAPISEELYSNGAHLSTASFELGDSSLDTEQALSLSAKAEYRGESLTASATAYHRRFGDFIYQEATGEEEDGLPVLGFVQEDATFTGLDLEATYHLWQQGDWHGDLTFMFDVVSAKVDVDGNDNLPRIPPSRAGFGLEVDNGRFFVGLDYLRSSEQDDVAPLELATDAYEDLRVDLSYRLSAGAADITLFLQGKNLTDDEQRDHTSFIKDLAPRPGRTVEAGIRVKF